MHYAHSLGYPHCDLMLAQLSSSQLAEILILQRLEAEEREAGQAEAEERRLMYHMESLARKGVPDGE